MRWYTAMSNDTKPSDNSSTPCIWILLKIDNVTRGKRSRIPTPFPVAPQCSQRDSPCTEALYSNTKQGINIPLTVPKIAKRKEKIHYQPAHSEDTRTYWCARRAGTMPSKERLVEQWMCESRPFRPSQRECVYSDFMARNSPMNRGASLTVMLW